MSIAPPLLPDAIRGLERPAAACRRPSMFDAGAQGLVGGLLDTARPMAHIIEMEFEWDDAKNNACFVRRGFDFAYAVRAFLDPHRIMVQDRR